MKAPHLAEVRHPAPLAAAMVSTCWLSPTRDIARYFGARNVLVQFISTGSR